MDILNEYKNWYYKELERSVQINNGFTGHLTLLSILGTGIVFIWTNLGDNNDLICFILSAVVTLFFALSCTYFAGTYIGYKYSFIDIAEFAALFSRIDAYKKVHPNDADKLELRREELLISNYRDFSKENRIINIKKSRNQHLLMLSIIIDFFVLFALVVYYFLFKTQLCLIGPN